MRSCTRASDAPAQGERMSVESRIHARIPLTFPSRRWYTSPRPTVPRQTSIGTTYMRLSLFIMVVAVPLVAVGCSSPSAKEKPAAPRAATKAKLGIRPAGDTEIQPDLTKIPSEDLKKVYAYID